MDSYVRAAAKIFVVLIAMAGLHACGGGGGDDPPPAQPPPAQPPPAVTAPSALSYTSPQTLTVGTEITALSPTVTGTVTTYAVSPELPAGLALDATTGVISGTPTAAAAAADYTVTASNAGGSTTFPLNITVNDAAPAEAPSGLTYASPQTFTVGTEITALAPTVTGTVTSYAVAPDLPAGLALDTATGTISGTPTTPAAEGVYTITASNAVGSTTFDLTLAVSAANTERVTTDRPDQDPAVPGTVDDQLHVLYVVPDGEGLDQQLDMNGTIEASVRSWNNWLAQQTGGPKLRLDTYGPDARLDVTFVQLSPEETAMLGTGGTVRPRLEFLLLAKGFDAPNKNYLAYYEGDGAGCGSAAWPPNDPGTLSVLYLRGVGTAGPPATPDCPPAVFVGENDPPGEWEYSGLHEALHPLGLAPPCAQHISGNGHVNDDSRDLLFGGTLSAPPIFIDRGHDDYFGGGLPTTCPGPDLMNSAFLDPKPAGAEEPPGHPYVNLTPTADCAVEATVPNVPEAGDTTITFVNAYGADLS
ncbi:MAG TPA: Ig domain-containing protein, partial [Gammaproteobacteria bacterium]|nr:Ig domain-containing protein [Gammaproteobacteria bacterium]